MDYSKVVWKMSVRYPSGKANMSKPEVPHESSSLQRFRLVRAGDIDAWPPQWLVRGLLERDALALVFGDPGCGKSFLAIDIALSVATGTPYFGREVEQGPVIYIAGEGLNGIKRRLMAWSKARGISHDDAPLYISLMPAVLTEAEEAAFVFKAIEEVKAKDGMPVLVVIDTVARNFGGADENSTKDMGKFIKTLDIIRTRYRSTVFLVHHPGHAEKSRARGAMALKGALDAEYSMKREADNRIFLKCTKMKEAKLPETQAYRLCSVDLPLTDPETGEACTSAVLQSVAYDSPPSETKKSRKLGKNQKLALDILNDLSGAGGEANRKEGLASNTTRVSMKEWEAALKKKLSRNRVKEVTKTLCDAGFVINDRGYVSPA